MVSSHCLICGSMVVSGLYCHNCLWEIKRIRLGDEEDLDSWMEKNMQSGKRVAYYDNNRTLESFSSP